MDKFYQILAALKKYQFWVMCGTMPIVVIVCWWLATAGLASQFQQRKTTLEGDFNAVKIQPDHPNQDVINNINKQHDALKRGVYDAWEILYRQQKEKNPLPKKLSEEFKQQFENLEPKKQLPLMYKEEYRDFIKSELPALKKIIDVRRPAAESAGGAVVPSQKSVHGAALRPGRPGNMMMPMQTPGGGDEDWIGTVEWNESDYGALVDQFEWKAAPSTLAVVLAQENLWVIEALLRVINKTNEGSTSYTNAAVKRIDALQIGKNAVQASKGGEDTIFHPSQAVEMSGRGKMDRMLGDPATAPGGAAMGEDLERQQLIEDRYVDDKDNPLPYISDYPYVKHPYDEFKMMPIHMNLVMDQRRLPKLLVECANSNMPIEVRRVRILKSQSQGIDASSSAGSPHGAMVGKGGDGSYSSRSQPNNERIGNQQAAAPWDMPVEICGVIYIYLPPDRQKLGTGTASTENTAETATPAAPTSVPAASPGKPSRP